MISVNIQILIFSDIIMSGRYSSLLQEEQDNYNTTIFLINSYVSSFIFFENISNSISSYRLSISLQKIF